MMKSVKVGTQYVAKFNDCEMQFDSKSDMLDAIKYYRENHNEINNLSMFKIKIYSLI